MNALIITALWGVVLMFSGIFIKNRGMIRPVAIAGLVIALLGNVLELRGISLFHINTEHMLAFTPLGLLFNAILLFCTLFYFLVSGRDVEKVGVNVAEYFALIFFVLCGISISMAFENLLMLFLGIEIISIPLYILTGSDKRNLKSNEASLKYFLMGAFSTGLMLMGIALLYGARKSFDLAPMQLGAAPLTGLTIAGVVLMLVALSFKVSAAPFHFWTPDVYDGAPTVFTSFMATIVKAAGFFAFIRLFEDSFGALKPQWQMLLGIITAMTLFIGNITAVFQQSVKRMLAYSSIAQAGFMLLAVFSLNDAAKEGILLYAAAYSLATIGIFAILMRMKDYTFEGFNGLAKHHPTLAAVTTIFLLSLAGIPLTAGFFSKFMMLQAALKSGAGLWLVVFAVLCAAVSVYYYFRVIQAMYFREGEKQEIEAVPAWKWTLIVMAALIILLGVFPQFLLRWLYF